MKSALLFRSLNGDFLKRQLNQQKKDEKKIEGTNPRRFLPCLEDFSYIYICTQTLSYLRVRIHFARFATLPY